MRVLLVESTSQVSGAERSLLELIRGLRAAGHDVTLAAPEGEIQRLAAAAGCRMMTIPESQLTFKLHPRYLSAGLLAMCRTALVLRRIVHRMRPDVVHANSTRAGLITVLARPGAPIVVHCRDVLPDGRAGRLVRRVLLGGADRVVAISRHVATALAGPGWSGRGVEVVDNAVDLERFDPARIDRAAARSGLGLGPEPILSVIAQITPWKGQDLAIRMLAELRRTRPAARLLIVGEAKFISAATRHDNRAFERGLKELVDELELAGAVAFLGERSDPECVLAATDLLLVPSEEEPFGRTIIEAMAMEVPVLSTGVGGPAEIIRPGRDGLLLTDRDPAVWARAAERLLDGEASDVTGSRDEAARRFSSATHAAAIVAVYLRAVDLAPLRARPLREP